MQSAMICPPRRRQKKAVRLIKKTLIFLLLLSISCVMIYNFQIIPAMIPLARAQASTKLTAAVQQTIADQIRASECSGFTELRYDGNGNVVSLETDTAKIARVNAEIVEAVIRDLGGADRLSVRIPIGNISGGALFTGRGPCIEIRLAVSPRVTCNIRNEFYESGINQTLHRIVAEVNTEIYALIPAAPQKITVTTTCCLAETVIVGKVPDAYTKINRFADDIAESEIDDIYDFGASQD